MKVLKFETNEEWMAARACRITGSRLKDIVVKRGTGKKKGYYELIAERIALPSDGENAMDRGHRLEPEAVERFELMTSKKVDPSLVIWTRDDNENIAISPDAVVEGLPEAVEAKCLNAANHIEAYLTQEVPDEFKMQVLQYFIVNDELQTLHLCFYNPLLKVKDFFILPVTRASVLSEIEAMLIYEQETLKEIDAIAEKLLSF